MGVRLPLLVFCSAFCVAVLAAALLPLAWVLAAAALPAAAFAVLRLCARRRTGAGAMAGARLTAGLVLAALVLALGWRAGYNALALRPLQALDGTEASVRARVEAVAPGYGEEMVRATLRVLEIEGAPNAPAGFSVQVDGLPPVELGQVLRAHLSFYEYNTTTSQQAAYAAGMPLGAALEGDIDPLGESHTLVTRLRQLQYAAAANIHARLPVRLSGAMAAMALGDRRYLSADVTALYRVAGLSHLLVVSGLHLSLLAGMARRLLGHVLARRKAALCTMLLVVLLMVFTGLAPSILRSGGMWLVLLLGDALGRRAHAPTSLALAVFGICLQNPWAVLGVGLQLSVAATAGMLFSGGAQRAVRARLVRGRLLQKSKLLCRLLVAAVPPACTMAATLPVLVWHGMGLSLLGIPANLVAIPLLPPTVLAGFGMALPLTVPMLNWLGAAAALVGGVLLRVLEALCQLCVAVPGAYLPLGGGFALAVVLVGYAVLFVSHKTGRLKGGVLLCGGLLALALCLAAALGAGTVRVVVAGGSTPSLVVIKDGQAAVLYRGRTSVRAVADVLWQYRVQNCALLVDLRQTTESTEYIDLLAPEKTVTASRDLFAGALYSPMAGVDLTVVRQANGTLACVDVAGYKLGCYTGAVDLTPYAPLDVLLAGSGAVAGRPGQLLVTGAPPRWLVPGEAAVLQANGEASLWLRPGKSVLFKEVLPDGYGI